SKSTRLTANGESHLRTLIYGAGHTGELILRDLVRTRVYPYKVVGFIDDDPTKWNTSIHGIRVFGSLDDLSTLIQRHNIDKLLVAAPTIDGAKMRKIVDICSNHHIRFKQVPRYANLVATGDAGPITLRDVQLEDLLDRSPVTFDHTRMAEFFVGKTVLVTGAAGSIGSEICRQVANQGIKSIVAMDLNENDLYFLNMELRESHPTIEVHIEMGSIRDPERVNTVFAHHRPHLVFHAAAHKHVPLMETCPAEAVKNNVLGTYNVVEAAHQYHAERFVLISTDKAVRPTNVMGASKRLAEFIIHKKDQASSTRYMAVRFGNVLGSNGSLVPILSRQIAKGGPITITHPKITRFFMTIPEAVGLVLVASVQIEGNLCVLDMGEPLSIDRLARQMISLSGLIPDKDIKIIYTGLRPGEKMYEELFTDAESHRPSTHPRIHLASFTETEGSIETILQRAQDAIDQDSSEAVYQYLLDFVPGFVPDRDSTEQALAKSASSETAAQPEADTD
ncbi:MAG: polysaccharide biosynthesis protein, partial [Planctomycetota bacterium]